MTPELRVVDALLTMQRNREELRAVYAPARPGGQFPRSATFRWLAAHFSARSLASTVLSMGLLRSPWLRLLGLLMARRRRR
jgi:hypothetical protein